MRRSRKSRRINLNMDDLFSIIDKARHGALNDRQHKKLKLALQSLAELANLDYRTSEKTDEVLGDTEGEGDDGDETADESGDGGDPDDGDPDLPGGEDGDGEGSTKGDGSDSRGATASDQGQDDPGKGKAKKRPGHGRIGADAYSTADHILR